MVSIIITTRQEPETLSRAIEAFQQEEMGEKEILVVGPDQQTERIVAGFSSRYPEVKYLKDQGRGKPRALNLAFSRVRGEIIILSDGDVHIKEGSGEEIISLFDRPEVGAVTGQPVPVNRPDNLYGWWAYFLTRAAHQMRQTATDFPCSGYLYALRKELVESIPEDSLAEDAYLTQTVREQGYQAVYAPQAKVYVKFPGNFSDWMKQKIRATGGYIRDRKTTKSRNFIQETRQGIALFFLLPKNLKQFFWTILLYLARIYLWIRIFWEIRIRKKGMTEIWQRVESTK